MDSTAMESRTETGARQLPEPGTELTIRSSLEAYLLQDPAGALWLAFGRHPGPDPDHPEGTGGVMAHRVPNDVLTVVTAPVLAAADGDDAAQFDRIVVVAKARTSKETDRELTAYHLTGWFADDAKAV